MKKPSVKKKEKEIPEDSSLGIFLKKSREERHVELDDIAEATRIRRYYLEAIENDEWEKLPSKVFIKGFLKSYAEFLGLDKEAVIHQYLRTSSVETNEPGAVKKIRSKSVKPYLIMIVSVLALIFIVAVIYLNERNISITNKAFQHLGTQSLEKKIEDIAKKEVANQKDEREKETFLSEDEGAEDEVTKTTLKLKSVLPEPRTPGAAVVTFALKYPACRKYSVIGFTGSGSTYPSPRWLRWWWAPMEPWCIPVIIAERLVEQTGLVVNALVNRTPWSASLSRFGVSTAGVP